MQQEERLSNVPVVPTSFHAPIDPAQNQTGQATAAQTPNAQPTLTQTTTAPTVAPQGQQSSRVAAQPVGYARPVAQEAPATLIEGQPSQLPNVMPPEIQVAPGSPAVRSDQVAAPQNGPLPAPGASEPQAGGEQGTAPEMGETTGYAGDSFLSLADVIASVYQAFPMINAARQERQIAGGQLQQAWGAYDTKLQGYTLNEPLGFYRNFRQGLGVARQTWWGGYVSAGYRLGRGDFQPWYKERETNEGGEFKIAFAQPLLRGRAIDPQRVAVFQASLATRAADPIVQQAILDTSQEAATTYWKWVAAGATLQAQRELLELATTRGDGLEADYKANRIPVVDLVYNRKLIADRTTSQLKALQKFREASAKLSLFLRDEMGNPLNADIDWVPQHFPEIQSYTPRDFASDFSDALRRRPEPTLLRFEMQQVQLERQLARNDLLPNLDLVAETSQDTGLRASSSNDKGQFEIVVGLQGEVPLQRNKAQGKQIETLAKIQQISNKIEYTENKIGAELQRARAALDLAEQIVEQAEEGLLQSIRALSIYNKVFEIGGKANLILINILETEVNESELKLVEAQQNWFIALVDFQAVLGLNPLDQAMTVSQLPESQRAGPGFLPEPEMVSPEELEREMELLGNPSLQPQP